MSRSADLLRSPVAPRSDPPESDRLEVLCDELAGLLTMSEHLSTGTGGPCDLSALRDDLALIIQAGARTLAGKLREELPCWSATLEQLERLAQCRYITLPYHLAALRQELERGGRQAEQIAQALEVLGNNKDCGASRNSVEEPDTSQVLPQLLEKAATRSEEMDADPAADQPAPILPITRPPRPARSDPVRPPRVVPVLSQRSESAEGGATSRAASGSAPIALKQPPAPPEEVPEVAKEPAPPTPQSPRPLRAPGSASESGVLRVDCPSCGAQGAIRWEKMGRLHTCRGCARSFRVDPSGGMVEVIRTKDNKWVDKVAHAARSRRAIATRFIVRRLLPALGVAALILGVVWLSTRSAVSAEVQLPRELQPRAELFTTAWLKKDWATMRLLTTPGQDRNLYKWYLRHPSPPARPQAGDSGDEIHLEVGVGATQGTTTTVKVRIPGQGGTAGKGALEQTQSWEERGGTWYFVVPGQSNGNQRSR
jgi:hypothetical protein